jgi:hypothetical protein
VHYYLTPLDVPEKSSPQSHTLSRGRERKREGGNEWDWRERDEELDVRRDGEWEERVRDVRREKVLNVRREREWGKGWKSRK